MSDTPTSRNPPVGLVIKAEDMLDLFETLGTEMQVIPAKYRDAVFRKLERRAAANGGPDSVTGLIVAAFKTGWMDYPR